MKNKKVYLTLQNGAAFEGRAFGADGEITGELVFSTGMVGYIETLTDPSNYGQIVVQTFPLIGNYGMMKSDVESDRAWVSAYVVREICDQPSNFRAEGTLETYLKEQGVIGIYGVDTRQITKILREEGAMNARVSKKPLTEEEIKAMSAFRIENAVKTVAKNEKGFYQTENANYTVALWNFGARRSMIDNLLAQGCNVIDMPATSTAEEILATGAHGVVLSDGAGNPAENTEIIAEIAKLVGKKPIFGIGLGHQLLALALGAKTVYTIGLQKSKPTMQSSDDKLFTIPGNVPNPINMPKHCYFKERCSRCTKACSGEYPELIKVSDTHYVACHLYAEEENDGKENA